MKRNRIFAGLLALALVLGLGLAACGKDDTQDVTPPVQTGDANKDPQPQPSPTLTEEECKTLVDEKLPEGYTSEAAGEVESSDIAEGRKYKVFDVMGADGKKAGAVAVDVESGDRYNYGEDGKLGEYSDFPLYNPSSDAVCDWNGVFQNGGLSVELMQADTTSFEFEFSDDTAGVARVKGNTASYNDGALTFTYRDDGSIEIGGSLKELAGTYTPA